MPGADDSDSERGTHRILEAAQLERAATVRKVAPRRQTDGVAKGDEPLAERGHRERPKIGVPGQRPKHGVQKSHDIWREDAHRLLLAA